MRYDKAVVSIIVFKLHSGVLLGVLNVTRILTISALRGSICKVFSGESFSMYFTISIYV